MGIDDIYFEIKTLPLSGEIIVEDGHIKWKYDSFMVYDGEDIEEHLEDVCFNDKELIDELLIGLETDYSATVPEYEDTWVYFYVEN